MSSIFSVLKESGCELTVRKGSVDLKAPPRLRAVDMIRTLPYPGFPTDMQPQIMSLLTAARGTSIIVETVFESRYRHAEELQRMGADIRMQGPVAVIRGVERLTGAEVGVWDLRGGAAMIIAALRAEGVTSIFPAKHIDRGYEAIEERLVSLGARIVRVDPAGKNQPEPKEGNIWTKEPGEEFPETGSRPGAAKGSQQPG
jgi:UDP-N-acetylglucosamine 1-carboxyvinyltransferase